MEIELTAKERARLRKIAKGRVCFDYAEAFTVLPDSKESAVVYHIIPFEADSKTFMPDWHLVAQYLVAFVRSIIFHHIPK